MAKKDIGIRYRSTFFFGKEEGRRKVLGRLRERIRVRRVEFSSRDDIYLSISSTTTLKSLSAQLFFVLCPFLGLCIYNRV